MSGQLTELCTRLISTVPTNRQSFWSLESVCRAGPSLPLFPGWVALTAPSCGSCILVWSHACSAAAHFLRLFCRSALPPVGFQEVNVYLLNPNASFPQSPSEFSDFQGWATGPSLFFFPPVTCVLFLISHQLCHLRVPLVTSGYCVCCSLHPCQTSPLTRRPPDPSVVGISSTRPLQPTLSGM